MKKIIISVYPEALLYKGHKEDIQHVLFEIAKFNGGVYGEGNVNFLEEVFKETDINLEKIDDATYKFGHFKVIKKEYVEYGEIIKTNVLW